MCDSKTGRYLRIPVVLRETDLCTTHCPRETVWILTAHGTVGIRNPASPVLVPYQIPDLQINIADVQSAKLFDLV